MSASSHILRVETPFSARLRAGSSQAHNRGMNLRLGGWSMRRLFMAALAAIAILAYWSHVVERGERAVARESSPASEAAASGTSSKGWGTRIGFVTAQRLDSITKSTA